MTSENRVHRLILPKNPADAYAAILEFAASLEDVAGDEAVEDNDRE